ncbi:hypothetical protein K469DRAFT_731781 [Zopfia rhizophila CBS 207.26]|uniref:Early meiotic induction protein 1 n=1 Tax=Zopfia rhizophila CBS 207.26 TaxID=1314779 RepID=A0A6A6DIQ6_9PEZI|nr:hypothetical protein K469DRAFT_731781 [Zopfia rhizophila CBS 207.26]
MGWWWGSNSPSESQPPAQSQSQSQADADADFHAAFPHLAPSSTSSSNPSSSSAPSQAPPQSEYPETMSCRAAFDSAFYCASFGGKFNDIYRYGELRDCSEHWSDFWFCMRIKSKGAEVKKALVRERYREKEERVKGRPNSEDVWEKRGPHERIERPFSQAGEL